MSNLNTNSHSLQRYILVKLIVGLVTIPIILGVVGTLDTLFPAYPHRESNFPYGMPAFMPELQYSNNPSTSDPVTKTVREGETVWSLVSDQTRLDHPDLSYAEHEKQVYMLVEELREFVNPDVVSPGFSFQMRGESGFVLTHPV